MSENNKRQKIKMFSSFIFIMRALKHAVASLKEEKKNPTDTESPCDTQGSGMKPASLCTEYQES